VGAGSLAALLVELSKRLRALQDVLADETQCRFVVVTRAAKVPVDESMALMSALRGMDIAVGAVIVNAVGGGACAACRTRARAEAAAIAALRRGAAGPYAIIEAPAELPPPHGAGALRDWGQSWRRLT
jgi:anion-transporting  ArsA/GET3 family ATPase